MYSMEWASLLVVSLISFSDNVSSRTLQKPGQCIYILRYHYSIIAMVFYFFHAQAAYEVVKSRDVYKHPLSSTT